MDKIEKIRKEIERRKGYISVTHFAEELLSFLDTLSEEPNKSLEEEVNRYLEPIHAADIQFEPFTQMTKCARHFAEWGADHLRDSTKMVDKGLEEAAKNNADSTVVDTRIEYCGATEDVYFYTKLLNAFIAGAEWKDDQLMKKAVEGRVFMSFVPGHHQMVMADVDLPTNTNVRVIVLPKEEQK